MLRPLLAQRRRPCPLGWTSSLLKTDRRAPDPVSHQGSAVMDDTSPIRYSFTFLSSSLLIFAGMEHPCRLVHLEPLIDLDQIQLGVMTCPASLGAGQGGPSGKSHATVPLNYCTRKPSPRKKLLLDAQIAAKIYEQFRPKFGESLGACMQKVLISVIF